MKLLIACFLSLIFFTSPSHSADPWPTSHPLGSVFKLINYTNGSSVQLYFWWWNEKILVEEIPVPTGGNWPYGLSGWGTIVQSGTQHQFLMHDEEGAWPPNPLYIKKIFSVDPYMDNYQLKSTEDSIIFLFEKSNDAINLPKSGGVTPPQKYPLSIGKTGLGVVSSTPAGIICGNTCSADFAKGTVVSLKATPDAGQTFEGWSGACAGKVSCTVTMDAAKTVAALFGTAPQNTYTLSVTKIGKVGTVTSTPSGINCGNVCSVNLPSNTSVILTASPFVSSQFTGWSGACSGIGQCTVNLDGAKTVTASFAVIPPQKNLTVRKFGEGIVTDSLGKLSCGDRCSVYYDFGATVELTAIPAEGFVFKSWSGSCSGKKACQLKMNGVRKVKARFVAIKK
jgi:3D (Asp-Asp-Asp) domain-containing protein